jgi:uncharacterized membrane-anchored protein
MGMIDTHFLAIVGAGGVAGCAWLPLLTPLFDKVAGRASRRITAAGLPRFLLAIVVWVVVTALVFWLPAKLLYQVSFLAGALMGRALTARMRR